MVSLSYVVNIIQAHLTTNHIANMGKGEHISMQTLIKICETLVPPPLRKRNAILQFFSKNYAIHNAFILVLAYINLGIKCFITKNRS